jgi:dTDP-4-dehydrorhamnose reductase
MKLLITGAGGMLGTDVVRTGRTIGHDVVALARDDLDVTDQKRVERRIMRERPGAVINCAAWTSVDGAEEHESEAERVNGDAAGFVAEAAARVDAKVIYISSDYVFDGAKKGPYTESDEPNPLNAYGRSKLAGERATAQANRHSFLVRTSWLFGTAGDNFVEAMLRLGNSGGPVVVVHDQLGCPTYTGHLAGGLLRLVDSVSYGIHHIAASGSCSWYEFAMEIFRQAGVVTRVMATTTDMMERPAKRPANSVLRSGREIPIELPDWERGLVDYLARKDEPKTEDQKPARAVGSTVRRQPVLDLHPSRDQDEETKGEGEGEGGSEQAPGPADEERGS